MPPPENQEQAQAARISNEGDRKDLDKILKLWQDYCVGKTNPIYERYKFNSSIQGDDSFDAYLVKLRALAATCEYGELLNELIRDRIVCGIKDNALRKRLLQEADLSLDKCVTMCQAAEATSDQMKVMKGYQQEPQAEVHATFHNKHRQRAAPRASEIDNCKWCGRKHELQRAKCPAYGKTCTSCGRLNHFKEKCTNTERHNYKGQKPRTCRSYHRKKKHTAHALDSASDQSSDSDSEYDYVEALSIDEVDVHFVSQDSSDKIMAAFKVKGGTEIQAQVDCGATCNVIPKKFIPRSVKIKKCKTKLSMYNKTVVPVLGKCRLPITNVKNGRKYLLRFLVVKESRFIPLIGKRNAEQMKLITVHYENIATVGISGTNLDSKQNVKTAYADVFTCSIGKMPGKIHLETDSEVTPVVTPPRRVPIAVKPKLKAELDRLTEQQVIQKVTDPTGWVSALVCVEKPNGKIRLCIDPKPLNTALKRPHYPMPTIEEILPELNDVKIFTKADLKEGFLQCELDDSQSTRKELQDATAQDTELSHVIRYIQHGWPEKPHECTPEARPYFNIRDELSYHDEIIVKGLRCFIPTSMRPKIRNKLHAAHTGIQSTIRYARETVYWPGMTSELKDIVSKCETWFLQCELDDESSVLTTFQTPWGRYKWNRLPFGVSPAPEVFQQTLDQNLEGLQGLYKIADDILITGKGETLEQAQRDHDANLECFLNRCRERHITLNYDKLELRCQEVSFMGHILTSNGLKPDPKKLTAINEMPKPQDVPGYNGS
ncbi:uncharacterized protein [Amphiura filiformis]|uniref:uncharacterized protein n=1 Tax=Amphiura filiformis TaxID=82378 RepID=UPI003B21F6BC